MVHLGLIQGLFGVYLGLAKGLFKVYLGLVYGLCPPSRAWPLIQGAWVLPCASPDPGTSEMRDALAAQCQAMLTTTTNSHIERGS